MTYEGRKTHRKNRFPRRDFVCPRLIACAKPSLSTSRRVPLFEEPLSNAALMPFIAASASSRKMSRCVAACTHCPQSAPASASSRCCHTMPQPVVLASVHTTVSHAEAGSGNEKSRTGRTKASTISAISLRKSSGITTSTSQSSSPLTIFVDHPLRHRSMASK